MRLVRVHGVLRMKDALCDYTLNYATLVRGGLPACVVLCMCTLESVSLFPFGVCGCRAACLWCRVTTVELGLCTCNYV